MATTSWTVGIAGTFDVANFGDLLFPRIFEAEVQRRVPGAHVRWLSPFGRLHPVAIDGGRRAEPLGSWSYARVHELGDELDAFVIGGGELAHSADAAYAPYYGRDAAELEHMRPSAFFIEGMGPVVEPTCPTAWHGLGVPFDFDEVTAERVREALDRRRYVSVRDELSRDRVMATGTTAEVHVVPDSAMVVDRIFPSDVLDRRLRHLQAVEQWPEEDRPIVVQGSGWMLRTVPGVAEAVAGALAHHPERPVVFVEIGPCHGDGEFADAVSNLCQNRTYRLPAEAPAEDVAAALANGDAYLGLSLHGAIFSAVYGVPMAIVNPVRYAKLEGFARLIDEPAAVAYELEQIAPALDRALARGRAPYPRVASLRAEVDAHFDRLVECLGASTHVDESADEDGDVRAAYDARNAQILRERSAYESLLDAADRTVADLRARMKVLEEQLAHERSAHAATTGRADHGEAELHRVNTTLLARIAEEQARVRELEAQLAAATPAAPGAAAAARAAVTRLRQRGRG